MNLNQVTLIGRLTRDPEQKALPSGAAVANFSVATSRTWKDAKTNEKKEETEFHNCVAFGRTAEVIGQYLKKGQLVNVVGRLQTRSWEDKDTQKKLYRTEIIVDQMQMGPKAGNAGGETRSQDDDSHKTSDGVDTPPEDINPDDIPF